MARRAKLQGVKELDRLLRRLPKKIGKRVLGNAVAAGGRVVRDEAKARVVVRTGRLRDSLAVLRVRGNPGRVKIGPKWPQGAHGHLIEFGTVHSAPQPFLRPAFDAKRGAVLAKIGDSLGRAVERAALKLAGTFAKSGLARRKR